MTRTLMGRIQITIILTILSITVKAQENVGDSIYIRVTEPEISAIITDDMPVEESKVPRVHIRKEEVNILKGDSLKTFSVVTGSFITEANARKQYESLVASGLNASLGYNAGIKMYRVVAATTDSRDEAVMLRDKIRVTYPDAWLMSKGK
ncbi:MAG: SPOR domain-containing protein [Prevotella sp.]|nr:SPOR domain-containing protein [Prevotella sp.]